jgi:predicted branched-subunit amino acid permease
MHDTNHPYDRSAAWHWHRRGLARLFSIPALILMGAFTGFSGLARDAGFSLWQTEFMVLTIWALPSKVVLIGAVLAKSSLAGAFIAVSLSAVRLMPMTVALVPEMRTQSTRKFTLYALSHFIAVTAWVMSMETFKHVPRPYRTAYFAGIACALVTSNMCVVFILFNVADQLPPIASAALIFVTPLYFLCSLWGSARERAGHYAMVLGLALTPVFHTLIPQGDILATGLTGGILAYGLGRRSRAGLP